MSGDPVCFEEPDPPRQLSASFAIPLETDKEIMQPYGHRLISKEAPSARWLLGVINTGMQWNGAWIFSEPAAGLCWAPSLRPRRDEKEEATVLPL